MSIMTVGMLLFEIMPEVWLGLFQASDDLLSIGRVGLRIIAATFPVAGFCIIVGSVFQAVGNPAHSMLVSIFRQLLVLLPAAWLFGRLWGLDAVWISFPVAEVVSLAASIVFLLRTIKSIRAQMEQPGPQ